MSALPPFRPTPNATVRISAVTGASPVELPKLPHGGGTQIRVRNRGSVEAFVEFGKSTVTAAPPGVSPGSMGLPAGVIEVFTIQQDERFVAVAVEGGTPAIEITVGGGE